MPKCVQYAKKHQLLDLEDCEWCKEYARDIKGFVRKIYAFKTACVFGLKYMFGVEIPRSPSHALSLDKKNGNTLWQDAMDKELKAIMLFGTFRIPNKGEDLADYQQISFHIVFVVKHNGCRKARLVAGGHKSGSPTEDLYSGVVGIGNVRLLFLLAAVNGLEVRAADISNAYLYSKTQEKCMILVGPEFGPDLAGKLIIIFKSLYGLKSAAARFHEHLGMTLCKMGYGPSKGEPNLWMKDCNEHYEYIATYVDDLMIASKDPDEVIRIVKETYDLKGVGPPEYYLGGNVEDMDEHWTKKNIKWSLNASTYVSGIIPKLEKLMGETFAKYSSPMSESYHPELDDTDFVDNENGSKCRSIGSLNWTITHGRFDIQYATSKMARFNCAPRKGHMKGVIRIVGYLEKVANLIPRLLVNPESPNHEKYLTQDHGTWEEFYPDAVEEIPPDMPAQKGKEMKITIWVDADHTHNQVTRKSVNRIVVMINRMVYKTVSKRQATVESSTYGSELVASRVVVDIAVEVRYLLRMLGIKVDSPAWLLGDNKSVVLNSTIPSSVLKKKHCAINYHRVREAIAGNIVRYCHIDSRLNVADCLTKPLPGNVQYNLLKPIMFANPFTNLWPGEDITIEGKVMKYPSNMEEDLG